MDYAKYIYSQSILSTVIYHYMRAMSRSSGEKRDKCLEKIEDLHYVKLNLEELDKDNRALSALNGSYMVALMKQEAEIRELKAKNIEWENKFEELIKQI